VSYILLYPRFVGERGEKRRETERGISEWGEKNWEKEKEFCGETPEYIVGDRGTIPSK